MRQTVCVRPFTLLLSDRYARPHSLPDFPSKEKQPLWKDGIVVNRTDTHASRPHLSLNTKAPPWFTVPVSSIPYCLSSELIVNQIHKHCVTAVPPHPKSHTVTWTLDAASATIASFIAWLIGENELNEREIKNYSLHGCHKSFPRHDLFWQFLANEPLIPLKFHPHDVKALYSLAWMISTVFQRGLLLKIVFQASCVFPASGCLLSVWFKWELGNNSRGEVEVGWIPVRKCGVCFFQRESMKGRP